MSTTCLYLGEDPAVRAQCAATLAPLGVQLLAAPVGDPAAVRAALQGAAPAFMLGHGRTVDAALAASGARSVLFPPFVALVDEWPGADAVDVARRAGVCAIVDRAFLRTPDAALVRSLASSAQWMRCQVGDTSVGDFLQMIVGGRPRPGLLTVACPHLPSIGPFDREPSARDSCVGGADDCQGWIGRLYFARGALLHAETPGAAGLQAFADLLERREGTLQVHEVFLEPSERTLGGAVQGNLVAAAQIVDDRHRGEWNTPRPEVDEFELTPGFDESPTKHDVTTSLDRLLAQLPGVRGVAHGDRHGDVVALAGDIDAESVCAVATMCQAPLQRLGQTLGFGAVRAWTAGTARSALYVSHGEARVIAAMGGVDKRPEALLKALEALAETAS